MTDFDWWLQRQNRPEKYRFTVGERRFVVTGKDKADQKKAELKANGEAFKCQKLYPFSSEKNQHNFELVRNVCMNRIYDIDAGEPMTDEHELERLYEIKEKADKYWCLPLPVAWLPWEELSEARELCVGAREHRANACIEAGRPDLVKYC